MKKRIYLHPQLETYVSDKNAPTRTVHEAFQYLGEPDDVTDPLEKRLYLAVYYHIINAIHGRLNGKENPELVINNDSEGRLYLRIILDETFSSQESYDRFIDVISELVSIRVTVHHNSKLFGRGTASTSLMIIGYSSFEDYQIDKSFTIGIEKHIFGEMLNLFVQPD